MTNVGGPAGSALGSRRVRWICIGCSGHGSSSASGDDPRVLGLVLAVAEPVVHLELDPRAGEQVERRRGNELLPRQQLAADGARVRLERILLAHRVLERDVAAETAAETAHQRVVEVVERPVERAGGQVVAGGRRRRACRAARGRCRRGSSRAGCCAGRSGRASRAAAAACPSRCVGRSPLRWRRTGVALRVPFEDWRRTDVTTGLEASQCAWQRPPAMER